uniref:protein-tyrosine-phosphatase n=1 Tax=Nothobranchius furzeri TaxID=105023 RepID=A0A8C6KUP1_NOTFU
RGPESGGHSSFGHWTSGTLSHKTCFLFNVFCRRGSNLSLLLDVSTLGAETVCSVSTPKEVWLQLLHTSSRPLAHAQLQEAASDTTTLNAEYQVLLISVFISTNSTSLNVFHHLLEFLTVSFYKPRCTRLSLSYNRFQRWAGP